MGNYRKISTTAHPPPGVKQHSAMTASEIENRLSDVRQRIRSAEARYRRPPDSVTLIAVSKAQPASAILTAIAARQRAFGESYLQEAVAKIDTLAQHTATPDIQWHFIGPIQSNKTRPIAERFHWVHSIDRYRIAQRLNDQRPAALPPLNVCVQVNISGETGKSGVPAGETGPLAQAVAQLPRLRLRGLMCVPAATDDPGQQRGAFRQTRHLQERLIAEGLPLDTLSMGMSNDLEAAIAEGATLVRAGTAVFGPRHYRGNHR